MRLDRRELVVLLGLAATFFVCFLIEPEWNLAEAHRLCDGKPMQVFDSMDLCAFGQSPGCTCFRPENPWAYVFWIAALSLVGIAASILLRSEFFSGAMLLVVALASAGACALFELSRRGPFSEEDWIIGKFVVAVYVAFVMVIFSFARAARKWMLARRSAV